MIGAAIVAAKGDECKTEDTRHYLSTFSYKVKWDAEKQRFRDWRKGFMQYCRTARVSRVYYTQLSETRKGGIESCETDAEAKHYFERSEQILGSLLYCLAKTPADAWLSTSNLAQRFSVDEESTRQLVRGIAAGLRKNEGVDQQSAGLIDTVTGRVFDQQDGLSQ